MFVTTPMDHLIALDAVTGKVLWKYDYPIDQKALKTVCCDVVTNGGRHPCVDGLRRHAPCK
jgi:alcohol dehydrogenase (cytochrome c)